jgi:hypothetical protein
VRNLSSLFSFPISSFCPRFSSFGSPHARSSPWSAPILFSGMRSWPDTAPIDLPCLRQAKAEGSTVRALWQLTARQEDRSATKRGAAAGQCPVSAFIRHVDYFRARRTRAQSSGGQEWPRSPRCRLIIPHVGARGLSTESTEEQFQLFNPNIWSNIRISENSNCSRAFTHPGPWIADRRPSPSERLSEYGVQTD